MSLFLSHCNALEGLHVLFVSCVIQSIVLSSVIVLLLVDTVAASSYSISSSFSCRLVVAKTAGTSHVIESTWDVDFAGVELVRYKDILLLSVALKRIIILNALSDFVCYTLHVIRFSRG